MPSPAKKKLSVFTLSMMTVAAVCSLRGLPMMAREGLSMIFYILFSTLIFLIPASLVAAELGGAFSKESGGVYTWVKAAFGSRWGFTAIWLQWIQNVVWYPTVLGFAAGALAYLFMDPELANSGAYTGAVILVAYWGATFITLAGTDIVSKVTKYGVLLGTVLPGILIIVLGLLWVNMGNPLEFLQVSAAVEAAEKAAGELPHARLFPSINGLGSVAFLAGIILLFAGVEVHAVHANELEDPGKQFPESMFLAAAIIFLLFTLGSLCVAAVIPAHEISLTAGLMQAFKMLLSKFNLSFMTPVIGLLVAFGAIGGVMSWISGPSRGLLHTADQGELPPILAKTNKNGMPINILMIQAVIVSLLAGLYFVMENVSVAFFMISAMTVTLYLVMYIMMYAAAIKLRYTRPDLPRTYKVPGGLVGLCAVAGIGLLGVCFALIVGFFPPTNLKVGNPALYVALVAAGMVVFIGLPLLINALKKPEWKRDR
ncbi:amino acid permease [Maridesulfovibrio salexigens]|uniref:Amino acid permease-associated region n=1 Tax=Maridesulfovibrio salexigens (strain ATCC 14822 / DSM 2638 / NCIMB 8403 / VKM B-1763) TaxID=526222 RepID=C6BTB5_MARSD|nr:amino acid permease [Maridesulfovibrio salexigens]ACS81596.1 amino acid permease-associated region [Maridesulfovibrio salexigens DSM 2638]